MNSTQSERSRRWRATPKGQFSVHKHNAKVRDVPFTLTFDEWWSVWQESGKWAKRGNRHGLYVMCRCGDEGPYALGNVYIGKFERNLKDARVKSAVVRKHTRKTTTVRYADEVGAKVQTTYGATEAPF